jgi:hypothetical protein
VKVSDVTGFSQLTLQASRDILFTADLVMGTGNNVTLSAGRHISIGANTLQAQGSGTLTLTANAADGSGSELDGIGAITTTTGGSIRAGTGLVTLSAGNGGGSNPGIMLICASQIYPPQPRIAAMRSFATRRVV